MSGNRDPRDLLSPPHLADEQDAPAPERPADPDEEARGDGQSAKPSQAEGER